LKVNGSIPKVSSPKGSVKTDLKDEKQIETPEIKRYLSIPVSELPKLKVEMRTTITKSQGDIEFNVSTPDVLLPKGADKVDFKVEAPKIEKTEIKGGLSIPVFELPKSKAGLRKSIPKIER
jgi:hypothetical protein